MRAIEDPATTHGTLEKDADTTAARTPGGTVTVRDADVVERRQGRRGEDHRSDEVTAEERRRNQAARRLKLESLGILAGGCAHDFNNLMMGVLGNADLALSVMTPDAEGRKQVEDIIAAARRAAGLADQLLAYSGQGRFRLEAIDLNGMIEESLALLRARISERVVVRFEPEEHLPRVSVDVRRLRQVFLNLVSNASEAIKDHSGMIRISTFVRDVDQDLLDRMYFSNRLDPGPVVCIEFTDTGCGIEPENIDRVFDPFFTTSFTGRGLGLAMVLGIIRGHGGGIQLLSEPRRGTTVRLMLPIADESKGEDPRSKRAQLRALVVDDDEMVRSVLEGYLENLGFEVMVAASGEEGIRLFRDEAAAIDCVILDYWMPGMGGHETLVELRRIKPGCPVILASGYDEEQVVGRLGEDHSIGFIKKPFSASDLIARLRTLGFSV